MSKLCLLILGAFVFSYSSRYSRLDYTYGNSSPQPSVVIQLLDHEEWKKGNLLPGQLIHLTYYDTTTTFDPIEYTETVVVASKSFRGRILHIE